MPFIPVPDTAQIELIFDYNGQIVENVFNVHYTALITSAKMVSTMQVFRDWYNTSIKPAVATNVILSQIKATDISTQTGPVLYQATGLPITGSVVATNPMPNNVTASVKWITDLRGRSYRGRTYHVGLISSQVSANQLAAGTRSALLTAYAALIPLINVSDSQLVVVSRRTNNDWRTTGVTTKITGCSIDLNIDSMRTRLAGRGS